MTPEKELLIEICKKCYLNCKFCSSNADKFSLVQLNMKQFKSIIDDSDRFQISNFQISGGEPFLHPNIIDMCELLSKTNKRIQIYTCGNIFSKGKLIPLPRQLLKKLKTYNVILRFNLQSHKKLIHNYLTNTDSYNNTLRSILRAIKFGIKTEIHIIPLKPNYQDLSQSIEYFIKLGISKIKFLRFVPHGRGLTNKDLLNLNQLDYEQFLENLYILKKKYNGLIEIGSSFGNNHIIETKKFCRSCQLGKNKIAITPEGKVFPCVSTKNLNLFDFSLKNQTLSEIIKSNNFISLVRKYTEENITEENLDLCPTQLHFKNIIQ